MKKYIIITVIVIFMFSTDLLYCQPPPPDAGGSGPGFTDIDVELPLNTLIYPFLVLGLFLGVFYTKKLSR